MQRHRGFFVFRSSLERRASHAVVSTHGSVVEGGDRASSTFAVEPGQEILFYGPHRYPLRSTPAGRGFEGQTREMRDVMFDRVGHRERATRISDNYYLTSYQEEHDDIETDEGLLDCIDDARDAQRRGPYAPSPKDIVTLDWREEMTLEDLAYELSGLGYRTIHGVFCRSARGTLRRSYAIQNNGPPGGVAPAVPLAAAAYAPRPQGYAPRPYAHSFPAAPRPPSGGSHPFARPRPSQTQTITINGRPVVQINSFSVRPAHLQSSSISVHVSNGEYSSDEDGYSSDEYSDDYSDDGY